MRSLHYAPCESDISSAIVPTKSLRQLSKEGLFDEFRKLEGNVLCIEINDDKVMSKLNKNDKS